LSFLLPLFGAGYGREYEAEHAQERVSAAQYEHSNVEQAVKVCLSGQDQPSFAEGVACLAQAMEVNQEAKRSAYDLKAQQEMAEWAFAMLLATLATIAVTIIGVIYVARTLALSRHSLIISNRAYVFLRNVHWIVRPNGWDVAPIYENGGNTPTVNGRNHTNLRYFPKGIPNDFGFSDSGDESDFKFVRFYLGPKATTSGHGVTVEHEVMDAIHAGTGELYVWGWVDYDDVFHRTPRHRTEFCFRVLLKEIRHPDGRVEVEPRFSSHWRYNGQDNECEKQPRPM